MKRTSSDAQLTTVTLQKSGPKGKSENDNGEEHSKKKSKADKSVVQMKTIMLYYWKKTLESKTPYVFPHISNVFRDDKMVSAGESHSPLYWLGRAQETLASMMRHRGYAQRVSATASSLS